MTTLKTVSISHFGGSFGDNVHDSDMRALVTSMMALPQLSHLRMETLMTVPVCMEQVWATVFVDTFNPFAWPALQTLQYEVDARWDEATLEKLVGAFCSLPSLTYLHLMLRGGWRCHESHQRGVGLLKHGAYDRGCDTIEMQTSLTALAKAANVSISFTNSLQ